MSASVVFPIACVMYLLFFFARYFKYSNAPVELLPSPDGCELTADSDSHCADLGYTCRIRPMDKGDIIPLCLITLSYAVVAFFMLGDKTAPESFCRYEDRGRYTQVELSEPMLISSVMYYSGLYMGDYYLQYSTDGENFVDVCVLPQGHADLFKWHRAAEGQFTEQARFIRIIAGGELEMGELALYDEYGQRIPTAAMNYDDGTATLFDEQELVPERYDFLNSTYFDEIYHARTAYENVENVYPYEVSHPPLGKLIISLGIRAFGMTPFGWRFMGVLFGVLMLPILYVLIKNMFGSTAISACGTLIFAFDFMHYTQTRIATIDTYAVFFILLMYLFMYRFVASNGDDCSKSKAGGVISLFLSGLFFGLGTASKWTCIYAGAGLALIWLTSWTFRGRDMLAAGQKRRFTSSLCLNILICVLFFVIVPALVYYLSYYPYGKALGMSGPSMFLEPDYLKLVLDNQSFMFNYHSGVDATHPYSSRWYQWIFNVRPILYYLDNADLSAKSAFGAFMNPVLCWGGLLAIISMAVLVIRKREGKALFILIGYLAQLAPWILIGRVVFEYHYFPSALFLTLALCHVFNALRQSYPAWRRAVYSFTAVSVLLFAAFYPVLSGLPVNHWYPERILRWFPSWPF